MLQCDKGLQIAASHLLMAGLALIVDGCLLTILKLPLSVVKYKSQHFPIIYNSNMDLLLHGQL